MVLANSRYALHVGLARTIFTQCTYGISGRNLAGKLQNTQSCTVSIYDSGQPYTCVYVSCTDRRHVPEDLRPASQGQLVICVHVSCTDRRWHAQIQGVMHK